MKRTIVINNKSHQGFKWHRADKIKCLTLNYHLYIEVWSYLRTAHWLIIPDIRAELFVNSTRGSKDIERTHCLIAFYVCAKSFQNVTNHSEVIERTRTTAIQCLTVNYDLGLEPTMVKHTHWTSTYHAWHLCPVICKSHQSFKRSRTDTKARRTDRRADGKTRTGRQTDRKTDNEAKNHMSPPFYMMET